MKFRFNIHFWLIFISAAMWGGAGIFVKGLQKCGIHEMQTVFCRAFFTTVILAFVILFKNKNCFKIAVRDIWLFLAAGIGSIVLFNFSYYKTMSLTSLSIAAVLLYTAPIFVSIMSVIFFREKLTINKIIALIMAFVGCCFVTGVFANDGGITATALIFGLLTGFGYSLYPIFSRILINKGYHTLTITFYTFLFAALGSLPLINPIETVGTIASDTTALLLAVLMALTNTVIPYLLYTAGLNGVSTSSAPVIATVEPVVATVISVLFYREPFMYWHFCGIVLVLLSVLVLNLRCEINENQGKCKD